MLASVLADLDISSPLTQLGLVCVALFALVGGFNAVLSLLDRAKGKDPNGVFATTGDLAALKTSTAGEITAFKSYIGNPWTIFATKEELRDAERRMATDISTRLDAVGRRTSEVGSKVDSLQQSVNTQLQELTRGLGQIEGTLEVLKEAAAAE